MSRHPISILASSPSTASWQSLKFEERQLVYHEIEQPSTFLKTVGVELDFTQRTLRHSKARVYRPDLV